MAMNDSTAALALLPKRRPRRRPLCRLARVAAPLVVAVAAAGCFGGGGTEADATSLLQRVNEIRASAGLPALTWCATLASAATRHATDMVVNGVQRPDAHIGSDGSTYDQRIRAAGYLPGLLVAENVAWGQRSVEEVLGGWMASASHRDNILRPGLEHAGFARVGNNWVQDLGAGGAC
jgi:uncharacterized protein YkwD